MNPARVAARARATAAQLQRDTCRIYRETGDPTTDPDTGTVTHPTVDVYTGQCRVRPLASALGASSQAGQEPVSQLSMLVSIPLSAAAVGLNDLVQVTASADPGLVGRLLRVRTVELGTDISARRLGCEAESR